MTKSRLLAALGSLLLLGGAGDAVAQRSRAASYLSYVTGDVALVSQNDEDTAARVNTPLSTGDRISTARSARAEAILADGTIVRFDAHTEARFDRLARTWGAEDDRTLIALTSGALAVETHEAQDEESAIRVDTDDATVVVTSRGLVRVGTGRLGTEVWVASGSAQVLARSGRTTLRAGESAVVRGEDAIDVVESDLPRDRFTQFLDERHARAGESARRIAQARGDEAADEEPYDDVAWDAEAAPLDEYGTWSWVPSYGRWCWRPFGLAADWRPYSIGCWRFAPGGLAWVSYEPWGWMPYHFGSWCFDASFGWCWLPGWSYSPAWVYWSFTPSWVGWCPIGYYGGYDAWHHGGRWEPGGHPHLRGRIEVTQVDPRGWSYVRSERLGHTFERTEVVRADRVGFRAGETAFVSSGPLRVDRAAGTNVRAAIRETVRRLPGEEGTRRSADPALTQIFRRDRTLSPEASEAFRRSFVRTERDTQVRSEGPRGESARGESGRTEGWRSPGRGTAGGERAASSPAPSRDAQTWRSTPGRVDRGATDERFRREENGSWRTGGGSAAPRGSGDHSGWRAPAPRTESRSEPRETRTETRGTEGWRSAPRREEPAPTRRDAAPRSEPAPRHESAPPRREMRSFDAPRSYEVPRSYEAPRPSAPSYESAPRHQPRYEPAPRYEAPRPAPPPRSYEAPRAAPRFEPSAPRSAPAPHAPAPAPRGERRP